MGVVTFFMHFIYLFKVILTTQHTQLLHKRERLAIFTQASLLFINCKIISPRIEELAKTTVQIK